MHLHNFSQPCKTILYNGKAYKFYWGRGATQKFQKTNCVMSQSKCLISNQNFKNLWIAPQLTKLINMNHNRLPNSSKKYKPTMVTIKVRNKNSTQSMRWDNMHPICIQECVSKIFLDCISICPIFFAKNRVGLYCQNKAKENHVHNILSVVKAFI